MTSLVRIPWEPRVWIHPDTLALLQDASRRAGHNIRISSSQSSLLAGEGNGGWRSWDAQNYLYTGYRKGLPGFNVASNPDTGLRQHMRGAALDISHTADRIHMLGAGFTPDGAEWWHFNHPRWGAMPIIRNLAAAGLNIEEIDMPLTEADAKLVVQTLRNSLWFNGEAGGATSTVEQILGKTRASVLAQETRQQGYGGRIENTETLVAALPREMAVELTERTILVGPDGQPAQFRAVLEQAARNADGGGTITIDRDALTAALAPTVTETLREVLGADLPDDIAEKTADVLARRLAGA